MGVLEEVQRLAQRRLAEGEGGGGSAAAASARPRPSAFVGGGGLGSEAAPSEAAPPPSLPGGRGGGRAASASGAASDGGGREDGEPAGERARSGAGAGPPSPLPTRLAPPPSVDMLRGCRSVENFERLGLVEEGTYGKVYKARCRISGDVVALKRIKMQRHQEGFPLTSVREFDLLLSTRHPNVVGVREVVVGTDLDAVFLVMEFVEHELKDLMATLARPFSVAEVKCILRQLLEGVSYLHHNWILHRDLKTSNLLYGQGGRLAVCDFGLARCFAEPPGAYSHPVVTLWYRAPELLLGIERYGPAVDVWSVGCIFAELLSGGAALFPARSETEALDRQFRLLGTPDEESWPGFSVLPGVARGSRFKRYPGRLREAFPAAAFSGQPCLNAAGFNLLSGLLCPCPESRLSAAAALEHPWFTEEPLPKPCEEMPEYVAPAVARGASGTKRPRSPSGALEEQREREERLRAEVEAVGGSGDGGLFAYAYK